jgi:hypothetical protein
VLKRLKPEQYLARSLASCVVIAMISVPLILGLVPPNAVYGFRTAFTMSSREVWYPANAFLGWALLIANTVSAIALLMLPEGAKRWMMLVTFIAPILAAVGASFLYLNQLS